MTLSPHLTADEINKLADAFAIIDKSVDALLPKLRIEDAQKLLGIRELDSINPTLVRRLRDIAETILDEGDEHEAMMCGADEEEREMRL